MPHQPPFRFIHCADLHLDSPFEGLQAGAQEIGTALWDATFQAYTKIIDLALEHQVDAIIIAGDVYDGADRSLRAQLRFRDGLLRAHAAGIQVLVAHGNHDPLSGWEAALSLPDNVHRFAGDRVERVPLHRRGELLAHVYGISYPVREVQENLASRFPTPELGVFGIGVLHCNVGADPAYDNYAPCTLADLQQTGLQYWALGHVHTRKIIQAGRPWAVYPGNSQGRSIRETGPRGCYLVRVDAAAEVQVDFLPTETVRWFNEELPIDALGTLDDLLEELERRKDDIRRQAGGRGSLGRLTLTGRGGIHSLLQRQAGNQDLLWRLQEGEAARLDFVWVEALLNRTRPSLDLAQRRQVEDLIGDFLRAAEALRQGRDPAVALRDILQPRPEYRQSAPYLDSLDAATLLDLLDEAEVRGVDLLLPEDH